MDYDTMVKNVASGEIYKLVESGFFKMLLSRMLCIDVQRRADADEVMGLLSQQLTITTTAKKPLGGLSPLNNQNDRKSH